jgi:hypothetical protein
MEIWECTPSALRNIDDIPLGGARAREPGASAINAKKHRRRGPWEVPELEIREHPPSMLRNVNDGHRGRCRSWSNHHQCYETSMTGPMGGVGAVDIRAPTINAKKHRW